MIFGEQVADFSELPQRRRERVRQLTGIHGADSILNTVFFRCSRGGLWRVLCSYTGVQVQHFRNMKISEKFKNHI